MKGQREAKSVAFPKSLHWDARELEKDCYTRAMGATREDVLGERKTGLEGLVIDR